MTEATGSSDVVVLGAGPAGLAAALVAARAGRKVTILEAGPRVGGMAASIDVAGQRVDLGSHRLHRQTSPDVLALVVELLGEDLQPRPRRGRIRLAGRWLGFPLRPLDVLRHVPRSLAVGFARDVVTAGPRRPAADTFAEQVRAGPGPTLLDHFYAPYARKLWGLDADELSGELFRRRVSARSAGQLVARIAGPAGDGPGFWYPRRGFGQIADAIAGAATRAAADIRLSSPVQAVARCRDGWRVSSANGRIEAPLVISTIPNRALTSVLDDVPADVTDAAGALRHRAALLVYLATDRPRYTEFDAHYFPEPSVATARISEPKNYRDGDDPAGRTVLCAELPATVGDERWTASDDDLAALVVEDLARCALPPIDVVHHAAVRLPSVYPIYDLRFAAAQARVEEWAAGQPGLVLVGRQALFAHDNTHHALEMGMMAGALAGAPGGWDARAWSSARERFRAHVVED